MLGRDCKSAAAGHGVASVHAEIQQHLFELTWIGPDASALGDGVDHNMDAFTDHALQQFLHVAHQRVQIEHARLEQLLATEGEQLPRQRRRLLARLANKLRVFSMAAPPRFSINSEYPMMAVRRLLKSWAKPPARRPTASSFCE